MRAREMDRRARFEILKRDDFTCQYCGAKAPDVRLQVDHIIACASGGKTIPENLKTSCISCNAGKGNVSLDDISHLQKMAEEKIPRRRGKPRNPNPPHSFTLTVRISDDIAAQIFDLKKLHGFEINRWVLIAIKQAIETWRLRHPLFPRKQQEIVIGGVQ